MSPAGLPHWSDSTGYDIQRGKARIVAGIDDFIVRDRRPDVGSGQRIAQRGDAVERRAHRAVAVGVQVRVDAGAAESHQQLRRAAPGVKYTAGSAAWARHPVRFVGGAGVGVVRLDHRAGQRRRSDDAVEEQLRVAHADAWRRRRSPLRRTVWRGPLPMLLRLRDRRPETGSMRGAKCARAVSLPALRTAANAARSSGPARSHREIS